METLIAGEEFIVLSDLESKITVVSTMFIEDSMDVCRARKVPSSLGSDRSLKRGN
jgi:hypothetical protein